MPAPDPFTTSGAGPFVPDDWARRRSFRVQLDTPVAVFVVDDGDGDGDGDGDIRPVGVWNLHDVSGSGAAFEHVGDDLDPGTLLLVRIDHAVAGRRFTVSPRAQVVRVAPGPTRTLYGVEWRDITDDQTDTLQRLALAVTRSRQRHVSDRRPA